MTVSLHIRQYERLMEEEEKDLAFRQSISKDNLPVAECDLRPARPGDFAAIAEILNLERAYSPCPEIKKLKAATVADIEAIWKTSQKESRPFLVAMTQKDLLLDRAKWPSNSGKAYEKYMAYKNSIPPEAIEVLGVAFMTEPRAEDIVGDHFRHRHAGLIRLVVHPTHRQKRIGSALVDKMISLTTHYHIRRYKYGWECEDGDLGDNRGVYDDRSTEHGPRYYAVDILLPYVNGDKGEEMIHWQKKLVGIYWFDKLPERKREEEESQVMHMAAWRKTLCWEPIESDEVKVEEKKVDDVPLRTNDAQPPARGRRGNNRPRSAKRVDNRRGRRAAQNHEVVW